MPREIKTVPVTFHNTGFVQKTTSDEIALTAYRKLADVYTDQEGVLNVRKGFVALNAGLNNPPYGFGFLKTFDGVPWRYAVANEGTTRQWYVAPAGQPGPPYQAVVGAFGLSAAADPRPFMADYTLVGTQNVPHVFLADGAKFFKHPGGQGSTNPARQVGIDKPAQGIQQIQVLTPDTESLFVGPTTVTASASGVGQLTVPLAITDLGKNDLTEVIEIFLQFPAAADALNTDEIVLSFSLGVNDFRTRWEKAISPSQFEPASQSGTRERTYRGILPTQIETGALDLTGQTVRSEDDFKTDATIGGTPVELTPGFGIWNRLRIRKDEFGRVGESGTSAPSLDWNNAVAMKVEVKANSRGVANVMVKDATRFKTGHLFGTDYQWTFTYFDSRIGSESDFATPAKIPFPGANHDAVRLTFPTIRDVTPPHPNPDKIRLYRQGGTAVDFQFVKQIDYVPDAVGLTVDDDTPDSGLGALMELDNQLPPYTITAGTVTAAPRGVELHDDRLWTWGAPGDPPNRLRYSKKFKVESSPTNFFIYVGTGSEEILRVLQHDGELFAFTRTQVYRVVGSDPDSYRAVDTPVKQGLMNGHAAARGLRSLYMYAYDGVYEFPSGRKISEPINPVFHNDSVNGIPALGPRPGAEAMAFWDNKLYFSYQAGTLGDTSINDTTLVWDSIYERWHYYAYGSKALFFEPVLNVLVGSAFPQNLNSPFVHQLESGFFDSTSPAAGVLYQVVTREFDLGMPDQEKRWIDLVVEADTQNTGMAVEAGFDDSPAVLLGIISTASRQQKVLPILAGAGDSFLSRRLKVCFTGRTAADATKPVRIFRMMPRFLPEPFLHRDFVTEWSDQGKGGSPQFFRELWMDLDTFGQPIGSVEVQVDQAVAQTIAAGISASGQTKFHFGLRPDIRGSLARLKFNAANAQIKLYDYAFVTMPEPTHVSTQQTAWGNMGSPYPKLWKECVVEIDTAGQNVAVNFWLDGGISQSWTVNTATRLSLTHSLGKDTFGKLGRITVDGAPNCRLYGVNYVVDPDPADVTLADSYDYTHSYDRHKVVKRMLLAMKNPGADVVLQVYADEVLRATKTIAAFAPPTGFAKRRIDFEAGGSVIKGMLLRFVFSSSAAFQIYPDRTEIELKGLNVEDGYARVRLEPPKAM